MRDQSLNRRILLGAVASSVASSVVDLATPRLARAQGRAQVVVVGGGFGGATAARALARSGHAVTLVERDAAFLACPFSNAVLVGLRRLDQQRFGYDGLTAAGVKVVIDTATGVDAAARQVTLAAGATLGFDRLILAPGIDLNHGGIQGYGEAAAEVMPHAWRAGAQTTLLARQLDAMADGGTVVMSVPANPYRCPPGPYERASLIAWYLKARKPRSKLIVLDAKDTFSKQRLFQRAWNELYPGLIEWVGQSAGGTVTAVDAETRTLSTDFGRHKADVANVIPPQRAGRIAELAGVADRSGWCPVDPVSFESRRQPGIHIVGDAGIMGAMPKSAFSANAQAKACALAIAALLKGAEPPPVRLINTCYSLVAPDYGISVAGVYRPANGLLADIEGAGGTSPLDAPRDQRLAEAHYGEAWFQTITSDVYG
ncbi:NAD(P)/FAD-dependent oxidoreductase [Phreatobacter stygius]|uniref:NAD(P)/FAD-dependent oxidoreductase n=1 Tax=Phreatobacter stygius TaxID=1940610 RepID=UPI001FEADEEE|nr:NAD(P)/FAD-dependent oxidoreductase [Phreatobacter stygius]